MRNFFILSTAIFLIFMGCTKDAGMSSSSDNSLSGEGGSMAAMTIVGDYMYRLSGGNAIEVYDISKDSTAVLIKSIEAGRGLETLFPFKQYLLIGTQTGMLIFDISDPANPNHISTYSHVMSCDPVVAQGNYAYVTLRNGNNCNRGLTQLEVIDISDIYNPVLETIVDMKMPHGLDADGKHLVVGEGDFGFKTFDITDPKTPVQTDYEQTVPGYDIISKGNTFIVVGYKGLYQYKYGVSKPELLSTIPISTP